MCPIQSVDGVRRPGRTTGMGYSGTETLAAGVVGFGTGMLIGALINEGNNDWGCNWSGGNVVYNRNVWASNSAFHGRA